MKKDFLKEVIGLDAEKEEIYNIIEWFKNRKKYSELKVDVPNGILLYGEPGNGKSLIIRSLIDYLDIPYYIFKMTNEDNLVEDIRNLFNEARKNPAALIAIDELDILVEKNDYVERILQEQMDGINKNDNDILVLAATNNINCLSRALKRKGRFDSIIEIKSPRSEDIREIIKNLENYYNIKTPFIYKDESIIYELSGRNFSSIKSIFNEAILRFGYDKLSSRTIHETLKINVCGLEQYSMKIEYYDALHEAGHCVMADKFKKYFIHKSIAINSKGGEYSYIPVESGDFKYKTLLADIQVSMAGSVATKILLNTSSSGVTDDLQRARSYAYHLVNIIGYKSIWRTLPPFQGSERRETQYKRRGNERLIEKILKQSERKTFKYLKKHIKELKLLTEQIIINNGYLNQEQINNCLS